MYPPPHRLGRCCTPPAARGKLQSVTCTRLSLDSSPLPKRSSSLTSWKLEIRCHRAGRCERECRGSEREREKVTCRQSYQYHQHTRTQTNIPSHVFRALPRALSRSCWHSCDGSRPADSFSLSRAFFQIDVKTTFKKLAAETMRIQAKTEDCRCVCA